MAHADPSSELATKPLGRLLLRFAIPSIFAPVSYTHLTLPTTILV